MFRAVISSVWFKTAVGLLLGGVAFMVVSQGLDLTQILDETQQIRWGWVIVGVLVIFVTVLVKAWRWRMLFYPEGRDISWRSLTHAVVLGQFFNFMLPAARLGDVARIFSLDHSVNKAQVVGTLVLEKTLDMIMVVLTIFVILPFVALPEGISNPIVLSTTAVVASIILYLLAYQTRFVISIVEFCAQILPGRLRDVVMRLAVAGLEGLAALRNVQVVFNLLLVSVLITILSVLTPFVLFYAFDFPLGLAEAAALNIALLVGSLPSPVVGNIGVFEFITIRTLEQFGLSGSSTLLAFALLFHLVVFLPIILWGMLVIARSDWRGWFVWMRSGHERSDVSKSR